MRNEDWMTLLASRAALAPARPRDALLLAPGGPLVGSLEPVLAHRLVDDGLPLRPGPTGWSLNGPADAALADIARWLHAQGLAGRWRDELLAVTDEADRPLATIERAAVRPLGITTHAVHLVVRTPAGGVWVQQRALDKATDPGLWDTTMGGLRAANETVHDTLERETWEEAGLRLVQLQALVPHGRLTVCRPLADSPQAYMVEHIDTFEAVLPEGVMPVNQDGEVAAFDCLPLAELRRRLQQDRFTLEAALVLLRCIPALG
jgi:8-oxo-dGTP pyrophosphatase MutT (NUDIX family)